MNPHPTIPRSYYLILVPLVLLVTFFFMKVFSLPVPIQMNVRNIYDSEFTVTGEGKVDVVPDTAYIDAGIFVPKAATAEEAQQQMDAVHNKIVEAMKPFGIEAKDVQTTTYVVNPNTIYSPDSSAQRVDGYSGNAVISIKVTDVKKAGAVAQAATAAGANEIQNTRTVVEHPEKYREMARDLAIANAKQQADKLSKSLGIRLGRITNFNEMNDGSYPQPMYRGAEMMKADIGGAAPVPADIQPGTETITSTVTLFYEKK